MQAHPCFVFSYMVTGGAWHGAVEIMEVWLYETQTGDAEIMWPNLQHVLFWIIMTIIMFLCVCVRYEADSTEQFEWLSVWNNVWVYFVWVFKKSRQPITVYVPFSSWILWPNCFILSISSFHPTVIFFFFAVHYFNKNKCCVFAPFSCLCPVLVKRVSCSSSCSWNYKL